MGRRNPAVNEAGAVLLAGKGGWSGFLFRPGKQTSLPSILQTITLAADVDGRGMVQQPIQNRGRDDRVSEDRTPVAVTFVGSQDDAATLITRAHQLEKDGRTQVI